MRTVCGLERESDNFAFSFLYLHSSDSEIVRFCSAFINRKVCLDRENESAEQIKVISNEITLSSLSI